MWKKYKTTLILTTLISLFPMVIGLLLWNRMPDTIATHFGTNNVPNGWSSKTMAVIGIPLFLAALQIFTAVLTLAAEHRPEDDPSCSVDHTCNLPDNLLLHLRKRSRHRS